MFWFILGLLLGSIAGFVFCALLSMSKESQLPENFRVEVFGPEPVNNDSRSSEA